MTLRRIFPRGYLTTFTQDPDVAAINVRDGSGPRALQQPDNAAGDFERDRQELGAKVATCFQGENALRPRHRRTVVVGKALKAVESGWDR